MLLLGLVVLSSRVLVLVLVLQVLALAFFSAFLVLVLSALGALLGSAAALPTERERRTENAFRTETHKNSRTQRTVSK
jgi:hypothetical protein